jgi:hypothetical protein
MAWTKRGRCAVLAAPAATLLLAACGGSNGDNPAADQPNDAKRLAFAACLRRAGVAVTENGRGGFDIRVPSSIAEARMKRIERDCARKTGGGPGGGRQATPEQKAQFLDQALAFARCMRAHGVEMTDPKPDRNGIQIGIKGSSGDPNSPVFRRAQGACGSLNPKSMSRSASGKK